LILSLALLPSPGIPVPGFGAGGCGYIQLDLGQQFLPIFISDSDDYGRVRWPSVAQGGYLWQLPYNPTWGGFKFYAQELNYNVHTQAYAATNWVATQIPVYLGNQNFPIRVVYADGPTSHTATMGTLGQVGVGPVIQYN